MNQEAEYLLVLSTCEGSISAKRIATDLVSEKLAACVTTIPNVQSWFRWASNVDSAREYLLLIKTTRSSYEALEKRIKMLHPYEIPEIIAFPIHLGYADYLKWIGNNTKNEKN